MLTGMAQNCGPQYRKSKMGKNCKIAKKTWERAIFIFSLGLNLCPPDCQGPRCLWRKFQRRVSSQIWRFKKEGRTRLQKSFFCQVKKWLSSHPHFGDEASLLQLSPSSYFSSCPEDRIGHSLLLLLLWKTFKLLQLDLILNLCTSRQWLLLKISSKQRLKSFFTFLQGHSLDCHKKLKRQCVTQRVCPLLEWDIRQHPWPMFTHRRKGHVTNPSFWKIMFFYVLRLSIQILCDQCKWRILHCFAQNIPFLQRVMHNFEFSGKNYPTNAGSGSCELCTDDYVGLANAADGNSKSRK